jgi:hypothetical protein
MTHVELVVLGHRWLTSRSYTVFTEFVTYDNETPDVIGWKSGRSILIECKADRGDFLSDCKKLWRRHPYMGLGRQRYYLCPWEMIKKVDLPKRWGLLWVRSGRVYTQMTASPFPEYNLQGELRFMASMLRRADIRLGDKHINEWLRWENRRVAQ